jgi:hypothetical protein
MLHFPSVQGADHQLPLPFLPPPTAPPGRKCRNQPEYAGSASFSPTSLYLRSDNCG